MGMGLWESLGGWQASQHPSLHRRDGIHSVLSQTAVDGGEAWQAPWRQHGWPLIILFLLEKKFFFPKRGILNDSSWMLSTFGTLFSLTNPCD